MRILAVGAHPDDVELGCYGTILEMRARGNAAYAVALAPGAYGKHTREDIERTWASATQRSKASADAESYFLGEFPVGRLQHDWDSVKFVDDLIERLRIDTIITHHYGEAHQDHLAAQRIAVSAARRRVDRLWLWESSIYTHRNVFPFRPQMYVSVSREAFEGKQQALQEYLKAGLLEKEEVEAHYHLAKYRGSEMHSEFAEAFEVVWDRHRDGRPEAR